MFGCFVLLVMFFSEQLQDNKGIHHRYLCLAVVKHGTEHGYQCGILSNGKRSQTGLRQMCVAADFPGSSTSLCLHDFPLNTIAGSLLLSKF